MTVTLRCAQPRDLSAIVALERAAPSAPHWNEDTYAGMLDSPAGDPLQFSLLVAELEGVIAGFAAGKALTIGTETEAELENVVVSAEARRQGIGRALCEGILDWAQALKSHSVTLEVRVSSVGAIELYKSLNFQHIGTRKVYYQQPAEDAILMSRELPAGVESEPH